MTLTNDPAVIIWILIMAYMYLWCITVQITKCPPQGRTKLPIAIVFISLCIWRKHLDFVFLEDNLLLEGRVCPWGEEDVKTRRQAGVERADRVVGLRADPSYVKLMTALQDLAQLLGQLLEGQGDAVLASGRQGWACQAGASDDQGGRFDSILWLVQEGDSLPHVGDSCSRLDSCAGCGLLLPVPLPSSLGQVSAMVRMEQRWSLLDTK